MSFRKVGWVYEHANFNLKDPNTRIKNIIHTNMQSIGWASEMLPKSIKEFEHNAIIFCSLDEITLRMINYCKSKGIVTIFHHMENIFGLPLQDQVFKSVDAIFCSSANLAYTTETNHGFGKCYHIDDPADDYFYQWNSFNKNTDLTAVYSGGSSYLAEMYRPHVEKAGWKYEVLTYPNDGRDYFRETDDYGGNPYWWVEKYRKAHVSICAHDFVQGINKSAIKVVTAWANGVVPVAAPIPSYRSLIEHNINGYLYHSFEDVTRVLTYLSDRDKLYLTLNRLGLQAGRYKPHAVAVRWMSLIDYLCA